MGNITANTEEIKTLIVGSLKDGTDTHHWIEISVPVNGSEAIFDAEEKAKFIFEEIPAEIVRFRANYMWQSKLHWQSSSIQAIVDAYGGSNNLSM